MNVNMTNAEAVQRLNYLRELKTLNNLVSAAVGYRIVQNIHTLTTALTPYYEVRDKTIKKYAKDGVSVDRKTDPEAFDNCTKELAEIDHLTINVEVATFPLSMIAECKFPLSAFFALDFMIEKGN